LSFFSLVAQAAADNRSAPAVVAVDIVAGIAESVLVAAVVADTVAVVAVAAPASLAVFDNCYKTSHQKQPEHRT
jgi:hypothetical protein